MNKEICDGELWVMNLLARVKNLEAENKKLKELATYARHDAGCNYPVNSSYGSSYGCRCGLNEIREKLKDGE